MPIENHRLGLDAVKVTIGIRIYPYTRLAEIAAEERMIAEDDDLQAGGERYRALQNDEELRKHSRIVLKVALAVQQINYQKEVIKDWLKK